MTDPHYNPPQSRAVELRIAKRWAIAWVVGLTTVTYLSLLKIGELSAPQELELVEIASATIQPIAFPHNVHAGTDKIDCQYCHFSAERSVDAGIPPVRTCIGCHQVIGGTDERQQAEIQKVKDYWTNQEAIPWIRIYKVADHVRFPHMRHVAADIDCATCHGQVQEMGVIEEVNQPLSMGWCVSCHIEREVSRDCAVCHY
mgnify:CR=1 FL=1|tara:strand:- start:2368 stop:2967 length:600 start_codon:yes stop_codon:yes gene_type:complete